MKKSHEKIKEEQKKPGPGDNVEALEKTIVSAAEDMAQIDRQRKKLNEQAAEIRALLKDRGVDRDAFRDVYGYYKKRRHEKDGYDESHKLCFDALNKAETGDMFDFMDKEAA